MKKQLILFCFSVLLLSGFTGYSQTAATCGDSTPIQKMVPQKIGIVISSNDPETVWNAFRLANYSVEQSDTVSVFLLGKGVESPTIVSKDFDVKGMIETFANSSGKLFACGTCLQLRKTEGSKLCPVSSLSDLYEIIKQSEIVISF